MTGGRRRALLALAAGIGMHPALRVALAQSTGNQGVRTAKGDVRVNGKPTVVGGLIRPGDTIEIGKDAVAAFVVGQDAFLMRSNSRAELAGSGALVAAVQLVTGGLLAVFGGGEHRLTTATATVGIRGTGAYMESEPWRTYFCLCYGTAEVAAKQGAARESYSTQHHDAPRYIYGDGRKQAIVPASVSNHTDAELILLESLVGRTPPRSFMDTPFKY
ncbi:MAG TPA: iron dicitrate transport regulator FecR [Burkholderiales bacterium]|nr:iron dicitrate transport regulator FecR [Burkholderiales bacterium]